MEGGYSWHPPSPSLPLLLHHSPCPIWSNLELERWGETIWRWDNANNVGPHLKCLKCLWPVRLSPLIINKLDGFSGSRRRVEGTQEKNTWKDKRSHFGFSRGRNNWGKSAFLSLHILEILYFWSTTADMQGPQVIPSTAAGSVSYSNNTGLLNKMDKCNIFIPWVDCFISNKFIRIVLLIIFIFITKHQFLRYFFYWVMNTLKKTKYI